MKKLKRLLAVVLSMALIFTSVNFYVKAEETGLETETTAESEETTQENPYIGISGDGDGDYWKFDPDTSTLTFYGVNAHYYKCDAFAEEVKHVVFDSTITNTKWSDEESEFPNLEDVYISAKMSSYSSAMFMTSTKIKEYIVDSSNTYYYAYNGDLYSKSGSSLYRYAVGKEDNTLIVKVGTKTVLHTAFYGNTNLKKIILPESVSTLNIPLWGNCIVDDIDVYNPDCTIDYSKNRVVNENLTIHSYAGSEVEKQCGEHGISFEEFTYDNVTNVSIYANPSTSIIRGNTYEPTGLKLLVEFEDGNTAVLAKGFKTSTLDTYNAGTFPIEVTYGNSVLTYDVEVTEIPEEKEIKTGVAKEATVPKYGTVKYYFEPEVTGKYRIYTEGKYDTYLEIYRGDTRYRYNDDSGALYNAEIEYQMYAGRIYFIYVSTFESSSKTFNIKADLLKEGPSNGLTFTGKATNDYLDGFQDLNVEYSVKGLAEDQQLEYGKELGRLEKAVSGVWQEIPQKEDSAEWSGTVYTLTASNTGTFTLPMDDYFGDLSSGEYRYTQKIGDDNVAVRFNIFNLSDVDESKIIKPGTTTLTVSWLSGKTMYFRAEETGTYKFYSTGEQDTWGGLYKMNGDKITSNDNSGEGDNFMFTRELTAGTKYMLVVEHSSSYSQTFDVVIKAPCEHQYEGVVTEATCTTYSYTTYTCTKCGDYYVGNYGTTYGHVPDGEGVVKEPTCTSAGYTTYACSLCGVSYATDHKGVMGHSMENYVCTATCTEGGYEYNTCIRCGIKGLRKAVSALGHEYVEEIIKPTRTEGGYTLHKCTRCDDEYKTDFTDPDPNAPEETTSEEVTTGGPEETTTSSVAEQKNKVTTKIKKITSAKKSLTIKWKKKKGISGYQIQISRTKKFKTYKVKNVGQSKVKVKFKKLKSKKRYYVRVRTYIKQGGKKIYSKWSKVKSKKTR